MAKRKKRRKNTSHKLIKFIIFAAIILCIGWFGTKYYFTNVYKIDEHVHNNVISYVQTNHSKYLTYSEIPDIYRKAIIATEDRSFFTNIGIDFKGIARAIYVDVKSGKLSQGGSTITQQLVHNALLITRSKSIPWKLAEGVYAIGVYDTMSKEETFELYSNIIYFGHGASGLYQASETYFGKVPSKLNAGELTMLAGLPNAPSAYDPYSNMKLARERQQHVVQSMIDAKVINEADGKQILNMPIRLKK